MDFFPLFFYIWAVSILLTLNQTLLMKKASLIIGLFCSFSPIILFGQKSPVTKFGKLSAADFVISSPAVDSNANAVIIFDEGSSEIEGNTKDWFSLIFKRHCRIKILNKNGLDEATVEVPLYKSTDKNLEEVLEDVKGETFNLENGAVVSTKLDSKSVFTENYNVHHSIKKFTFPGAKEGSIIEFSYTIVSDYLFNLQPWQFQSNNPCLWSEYNIKLPNFLDYTIMPRGSLNFFENKMEDGGEQTFKITDRTVQSGQFSNQNGFYENTNITDKINKHKWVMKDIPSIREEPFTTTVDNYYARLDFQLAAYRFPGQQIHPIMSTWPAVNASLLDDESFGLPINRANNWLDDDMKAITSGATDELEKAKKIFSYVRDNFTVTGYGYMMEDHTSLKDIFKKRSSNVAGINLLLIAMMRHEGISSSPVILSTRAHGFVNPTYPLLEQYNYVVCRSEINKTPYYLDASQAKIGFAVLPLRCYNGSARVIKKEPMVINFFTDSIRESKTTTVIIANDNAGNLSGSVSSVKGYYESLQIRNELSKKKKEDYFKGIVNGVQGVTVQNLAVDGVSDYDEPVTLSYDLKLSDKSDIIYFSPMLTEGMKSNPFISVNRVYPVELPHRISETYILNMEIPKGYKVDELPKAVRVKLNDEDGMFEYIVDADESHIQLRSRIVIDKAIFPSDDYASLRDFYTYIVKKESEQIVLKKIK
jgi:hypothetical protein